MIFCNVINGALVLWYCCLLNFGNNTNMWTIDIHDWLSIMKYVLVWTNNALNRFLSLSFDYVNIYKFQQIIGVSEIYLKTKKELIENKM